MYICLINICIKTVKSLYYISFFLYDLFDHNAVQHFTSVISSNHGSSEYKFNINNSLHK